MPLEQIEKRITRIEERDERYEKMFTEILTKLGIIETKVAQPHPCKWDNIVPVLVEFKNNTDPIRSNIFRRLDHHDDEIIDLKSSAELIKQNNTLLIQLSNKIEEMEKEEVQEVKSQIKETRGRKDRLLDAVIGGVAVGTVLLVLNMFVYHRF